MSLRVEHLSRVFGEQIAVNDVSFHIQKGEITGFLGPNGAGKSTTMRMICGYIPPTQGRVEVCGTDISQNPQWTLSRIGYLPESNPLYTEMYVREYLHFLAGVHHISAAEKTVEEVIVKTGLLPESRKKIGTLSKGYRQRVGIAQAMLHNPEVLILDEPTSGLDPNQIIEIRDVIRAFGKEKTVLLSTHIMQEVEALCDRVIIIYKGKLVADEKLPDLQKRYSDLSLEEIFRTLTVDSE
ncbi:MAG TPA: ATP-binding cassette domain-containing protein [Chitinophagaceae bacterium]|nr:ATP-binding cassette domain-containing protein [Chitinophagaceae bacterium]